MNRRNYIILAAIVLLVAVALWIDLPGNPGIQIGSFTRSLETQLGLDLRGGLQVLLEADLPAETEIDPQSLQDAKQIVENRSNGLGVSEVVFQIAGTRRIVGEFPGLTNVDEVLNVLKQTGQLEFVDMGSNPAPEGTMIVTDQGQSDAPAATETPVAAATEAPVADSTEPVVDSPTVYHTVMTGSELKTVAVNRTQVGQYVVEFTLKPDGTKIFKDYTTNNVGRYLAIVLDKRVISTPIINSAITEGSGMIEGNFTVDSANALAIQLRYGSLPVPLKVVESRIIGPTLGEDSLNKSLIAGIIGLVIVILFMAIYYRLPGLVADIALIVFALLTFALYKVIPITLTLPGIAGLLLSTGSALDANILIFERLKEELLAGRTLKQAVQLAWNRAWPSIRDSNIATIITCVILFWFGSSFGASIVKGFAVTLILGVGVSLFCALLVTRTLLAIVIDWIKPTNYSRWFGL
jgi:preprotein translocase subunit SecD